MAATARAGTGARPRAHGARLLALVLAVLVPAAAAGDAMEPEASPDCASAAAEKIQHRYERVRDLSARFEQTSRPVALGPGPASALSSSSGTVVFAKPGRMRWVYEKPERSEVVSDGNTLWLYDPAHHEVQRLPVGDGYLSGAAVQFLLGEGDMRKTFRVVALACREDSVELELWPLAPATYEKLRIEADPETGDLRRTTIVDLLGNVTEVRFSDVRVNQEPADDVFLFQVPRGVEVIEIEPPSEGTP